jgi:hypothetical protein
MVMLLAAEPIAPGSGRARRTWIRADIRTRRPKAQDQGAAAGQMAVATWQKSTARRLVSVFAVPQVTNQMLCG